MQVNKALPGTSQIFLVRLGLIDSRSLKFSTEKNHWSLDNRVRRVRRSSLPIVTIMSLQHSLRRAASSTSPLFSSFGVPYVKSIHTLFTYGLSPGGTNIALRVFQNAAVKLVNSPLSSNESMADDIWALVFS